MCRSDLVNDFLLAALQISRCVLCGSVREGVEGVEGVQWTEIAHPANILEGGLEGGESSDCVASGTIEILSHHSNIVQTESQSSESLGGQRELC